jgi:hypothetical protein
MAGDQATGLTPKQVGEAAALNLGRRAIKQALAAAPNTPAGMQQEITKLAQRNPSLQEVDEGFGHVGG